MANTSIVETAERRWTKYFVLFTENIMPCYFIRLDFKAYFLTKDVNNKPNENITVIAQTFLK